MLATAMLAITLPGFAPPERTFTAPSFGKEVANVRLGVSIAEGLHPGREIPARVVIENHTANDLLIGEGSTPFSYEVSLVDERGKSVDPTLHFRRDKDKRFPTTGHVARVAPGRAHTDGLYVNVMFDTSLAGRYRMTVGKKLTVGGKLVALRSGEITFDLTEEP